jgi:hypothetical protein
MHTATQATNMAWIKTKGTVRNFTPFMHFSLFFLSFSLSYPHSFVMTDAMTPFWALPEPDLKRFLPEHRPVFAKYPTSGLREPFPFPLHVCFSSLREFPRSLFPVSTFRTCSHWGQGYLDFSGNMLSTLQALRHFAQHLPSRNVLFTSGM